MFGSDTGIRDATRGGELWKTNGTAAGTAIVIDLFPGPDWGVAD